ncbi:MAG: hypothetical protein MSC31_15895 [Solirubrobacteraceae bacterium MAG38_C4-C5]|nr:hypothetical protein [Candidatus Siliceabacter maunaloa]
MRKKLRAAAVVGAAMSALAFAPAGASAAHCTAPADEPSKPGFSYFGTDHVQGENGPDGTNQGTQGDGTSGASSCRETTGSPSERAPGQSK